MELSGILQLSAPTEVIFTWLPDIGASLGVLVEVEDPGTQATKLPAKSKLKLSSFLFFNACKKQVDLRIMLIIPNIMNKNTE